MASNYTSNYQLCQWEGTDKVLRTDFNGDNAKIDAALKANADAIAAKAAQADPEEVAADLAAETAAREAADAALENRLNQQTLFTYTASTAGGTLYIPVSGISWTEWKHLRIRVHPVLNSSCTYALRINHSYALGGSTPGDLEILLMPLWGQAPGIIGLYWGDGGAGQICYSAQSYGDIQQFSLQTLNYNTELFLAGTSLIILGEKG